MADRVVAELRAALEAATPDVWPRVRAEIAARAVAGALLAALDRPPSPHTRLGWELRRRVDRSICGRRAA